MSAADPSPSSASAPAPTTPKLPPLTPHEFREYNRLAERMDAFHAHFRATWDLLYDSASAGRRARGLSLRAFVSAGLEFVSHLETHHAIEERYVFPELARRMPEFRTGKERNLPPTATTTNSSSSGEEVEEKGEEEEAEGEEEEEGERQEKEKKKNNNNKGRAAVAVAAELLRQHVEIHRGMDGLRDYLGRCLSGETELQMPVLKAQLDTWRAVLWQHLDQEVRTLGAENMRRYWSLDEMRKFRM